MTRTRRLLAALLVPVLAACGSTSHATGPSSKSGSNIAVNFADRPFQLHIPGSYQPTAKLPLIVLLHGYTSDAATAERYFGLTAEADRRGFLLAMPEGTKNAHGERFWNATDACCDFSHVGTDDSGYLHRLIEAVKSAYSVDPARVYIIGHSNGGFMAYRMACDHADDITAVVSLAGMATNNPADCSPSQPVTVLHIHGTADDTILYDGSTTGFQRYPSAGATVELWRRLNGCSDQATTSAPLDLEAKLPGAETTVTTYQTGCRDGVRAALWAISGGAHVPALSDNFTPAILNFLLTRG
jgi:polyhydroxybutyrate depolymerase